MGYVAQNEQKKVAIITGSTSGIGADLARHLHGRGYNVVVSGRRVEEGKTVASELDPSGQSTIFVQTDVASYSSQANLFKETWDKWGRLDVLIANAGCVDKGSIYNFAQKKASVNNIPGEPDLSATDIDFKGTIYGTTLATHFMRHNATPGGKIIVTGSMIGIHPCPTFPEYSAAKAGCLQWTRVMAPLLMQKEGISINTVLPGAVDGGAMPGFSIAFLPEHLTLKTCLMSAYDIFLDDESNQKTGLAVETAHDKHFYHEVPEYKSGDVAKRNEKIYEPWFVVRHGEKSDLGERWAIQGPPKRK